MSGLKPFWANTDEAVEWLTQTIFGAEDGEEDGDSGADDADLDDLDDNQDGTEGDGDQGEPNEISEDKQKIIDLSSEAKKRRLALREKEKENQQLKARLTALENKDKNGDVDEETRAKIEGPINEKYTKLLNSSRNTAIKNAILAEGQKDGEAQRVWHSAETVISQMNMDDIDFDPESGSIEGVSEELDRIATEQPFLIKSTGKAKRQNKKEQQEGNQGKPGASGYQPGGAGRQVQGLDAKREKELKAKFPVLNRR